MRKQFIGVVLLMMGMDNLYNLKDSGVALADFSTGQWAALVVSIIMVGLGLYLSIVGWLEWRKVMAEREKEKKEAEEQFKREAFEITGGDEYLSDLDYSDDETEEDTVTAEYTETEEEEETDGPSSED